MFTKLISSEQPYWQRAIILVDMNAFFAAIEQRDNPELRGRPLAITNGQQGTCIITCSYEAREYGIKTGMRLKDAYPLCPQLLQIPARQKHYANVSRSIMQALATITPDIEIFSVDEAFLDVTHCQRLHGSPEKIGLLVREKVFATSQLLCSIGISGDKTTAKFAAKLKKPNGFNIILPWDAKQRLQDVTVRELCGIGSGIAKFLARYHVYTCGDMEKIPIGILAKRFGNIGRRIWYMCQGADPEPVKNNVAAPKSMGHGKVMPPNTCDSATLLIYLLHMCEKLAARLRRHQLKAQHFYIGWLNRHQGWLGEKCHLVQASNDGKDFYQLGRQVLKQVWHGEPVCQIQVTALDPQTLQQQYDLFLQENLKRAQLNSAIDKINQRYGEFMVAPATLLQRADTENSIAPAWKPYGPRETI